MEREWIEISGIKHGVYHESVILDLPAVGRPGQIRIASLIGYSNVRVKQAFKDEASAHAAIDLLPECVV